MTQQSSGAFDSVLGRACSCGCLVGNRKTECSTQLCNGHRRLAIPIWVVYFASSQGRSLLASKGFLSAMPEALWFGLTFGVFTRFFSLPSIYYGDAKRRQMLLGLALRNPLEASKERPWLEAK